MLSLWHLHLSDMLFYARKNRHSTSAAPGHAVPLWLVTTVAPLFHHVGTAAHNYATVHASGEKLVIQLSAFNRRPCSRPPHARGRSRARARPATGRSGSAAPASPRRPGRTSRRRSPHPARRPRARPRRPRRAPPRPPTTARPPPPAGCGRTAGRRRSAAPRRPRRRPARRPRGRRAAGPARPARRRPAWRPRPRWPAPPRRAAAAAAAAPRTRPAMRRRRAARTRGPARVAPARAAATGLTLRYGSPTHARAAERRCVPRSRALATRNGRALHCSGHLLRCFRYSERWSRRPPSGRYHTRARERREGLQGVRGAL